MIRKSLSIVTLSVFYFNSYAQITTHLGSSSTIYVQKNALYFNKGGMQIHNGLFKNTGKTMIIGSGADVFTTLNEDGTNVTQDDTHKNIGGRFLNVLNSPANYALANTTPDGNNYTYGQLFISGVSQNMITGYVQQEYRNVNHGAYQQIGLPFFQKSLPALNVELNKTFFPVRWSQNEILRWDNNRVVFDNLDFSQGIVDAQAYYILGNKTNSIDISNVTRVLSGKPYTDGPDMIKTLVGAGANVNFGEKGNNINQYNERYNTYVQDGFELQSSLGGVPWQGNYGKNLYQFSNPFLINIDLRNIFVNEITGDNNYISNIYGIRLEQQAGTVTYTAGQGGGTTSFRFVTWDNATQSPVGDVDWLIVRPLSVFTIKLKDNLSSESLNFNNLRRFAYTPRAANTPYSPTSAKAENTQKKGNKTVKQLGVIALNSDKIEIGRTYYVVSETANSGHAQNSHYQVSASAANVIGTYEEDPLFGGYDFNYSNKYWLYINEANEASFQGKSIPAVIYDKRVKYIKFEIRESAELLAEQTSNLSSGIPFYYNFGDGLKQISQYDEIAIDVKNNLEGQLYYGRPAVLATGNEVRKNKTRIVYNQDIEKYIIRFDPKWEKADVEVFDMSGRLIMQKKKISTSQDFVINLSNVDATYYVKTVSANGEIASSKIIPNIFKENKFIK